MEANALRGINRRLKFEVTTSLIERFKAKVCKREPEDCWPWVGSNRNGYGAIKHSGRVLSAHVVSFVIAKGEIPEGMIITHSCDNRLCCNPSHLSAASPQQNVKEMFERRDPNVCCGTKSPSAVLTDEMVTVAWALKIALRIGSRKVGERLGVSHSVIQGVFSGKSWKHVPVPPAESCGLIIADYFSS
jgi:hypothetical protein